MAKASVYFLAKDALATDNSFFQDGSRIPTPPSTPPCAGRFRKAQGFTSGLYSDGTGTTWSSACMSASPAHCTLDSLKTGTGFSRLHRPSPLNHSRGYCTHTCWTDMRMDDHTTDFINPSDTSVGDVNTKPVSVALRDLPVQHPDPIASKLLG